MLFFIDAEFNERGRAHPIELISIAIAARRGPSYYAVSAEFDPTTVNDWVKANVLPHLTDTGALPLADIAVGILAFVEGESEGEPPEFWSAWGSYDWVVLCQLFGSMVALPAGWPMYVNDVVQWAAQLGVDLPPAPPGAHHATVDARYHESLWELCDETARLRAHQRRLFFDDTWRRALSAALSGLIYDRFNFEARFAGVATALSRSGGQGVGGVEVAPRGHRVWFLNDDGTVAAADIAGPGTDVIMFTAPSSALDVALDLEPDELEHWDLDEAATRVAADLGAQMWAVVAELLAHAPPAPTMEEARMVVGPDAVVIGPGAAAVADALLAPVVEVPDGVVDGVVVVNPAFLTLASWGLATREHLDHEGWHLVGQARVAAVLTDHGACRYVPA